MYPGNRRIVIIVSIFLVSTVYTQNSVKSVNDNAIKDFQESNYTSAIEGMKRAIEIIKAKQEREYASLLPQPLPGWTKGERIFREIDPRGIDKGYIIEQTYNKPGGFIKAGLIINSPMVNDVKSMLNRNNNLPTREGYSYDSFAYKKAFVRFYENQNMGEITILASSSTIATIFGNNVSLREMHNYANSFKFSEINKVK